MRESSGNALPLCISGLGLCLQVKNNICYCLRACVYVCVHAVWANVCVDVCEEAVVR